MLTSVQRKQTSAEGKCFAIVASEYNGRYVDAMLRAARSSLKQAGAASVEVIRVPGAFEIPVVAAALASAESAPDAIICLGVVLRGETTHAENIVESVSHALVLIQVEHRVPVIHEVLLLENEDQAAVRCLGRTHNRGSEAAATAISMTQVMVRLRAGGKLSR